jgi:hypothetical protein
MVAARSNAQMGCPRVAAFDSCYLFSHQVQDRLLPLE